MAALPADPKASVYGEEDDYMSMTIVEPTKPKEKETYTQRRIRKQREAEIKGRTKSKKELEEEAAAARDAALATSLPADSKGFKMMAKLGFKPGTALGASTNFHARAEPLGVVVKEDRGGIGLDSEKKRKFREEMEGEAKRVKAEEGEYRDRVAREREERRLEGLVGGAMRVAERLDTEQEAMGSNGAIDEVERPSGDPKTDGASKETKPTKQINVLWRGLVRQREEKERERRARYDLLQSLSRNATYDDPEEGNQDRQAWGTEEEEVEVEDAELDEFNAIEPAERLGRLVAYLRTTHRYCFWCKFQYPDAEMEGCPGITEEDHD
ncbi:MAG: hypothetical protein FRX48_00447 [Lasallia pustulata]|uniref:G-patch domain-containing protein n=1 Tax=Lasallia pustulata TaxID=136370 RepID=A0A5M8Q3S5_9LECA|nr:MAG: hypothetical protein FRX48_00447 [Lasallia pustulata]